MRRLKPSRFLRAGWNRQAAAHLLRRTGFGPLPKEINRAWGRGLARTVEELLDFSGADADLPPPEMPANDLSPRAFRNLSKEEKRKLRRTNQEAIEETRGWWIRRMRHSRLPLREKLVLFWHGHFTTSANDVRNARHVFQQNDLFRQQAAGNFRDLVLGISRDPAMLRYLDNNTNRKQHPNENYARELLELFTMGIGHYTEQDVKEAARAFTGWTFRGDEFVFARFQHDFGEKTFLGKTGTLDGADVIDAILAHPATAPFIAGKLFRFFAYADPEPALVTVLGDCLRRHNYAIGPFLRDLFQSEVFYSDRAIGTQIKSPAELVVGTVRLLGVDLEDRALAVAMRSLGQDLFYPPNVKGWVGGEAWIDTNTLLARYNLARYFLTGQMPGNGAGMRGRDRRNWFRLRRATPTSEVDAIVGDAAPNPGKVVDLLADRLLAHRLDSRRARELAEEAARARAADRPRLVAHLLMCLPEYQLC